MHQGQKSMELPTMLKRGEHARLFPVLADTSKEGRTLSIFLACLPYVDEFGKAMLASIGERVGARTRIETFTEVVCDKEGDKNNRPDGLIVVRNGSKTWTALVEAKVGNAVLTPEQLEAYLEVAKLNGIDALITLSNQFAPLPTHHPVKVSANAKRKVALFHWSWMYVLTQASLLIDNEEVTDKSQKLILSEMRRFFSHPSAGVKSFDSMPASWTDLVAKVQAGGSISGSMSDAKEIMGAWHQELRDLSLILTRQLRTEVNVRIPRRYTADPGLRLKEDVAVLCSDQCLQATFLIPAAAAPVDLCADLAKKTVSVSMKIRAPEDRKGAKARISWLLRQIAKAEPKDTHVRLFWPGRGGFTQHTLLELRDDPDKAVADRNGVVPHSFEISLVKDLAGRFAQRRNFIVDLETVVPAFYEQIGQHIKSWQPSAPKMTEERTSPESVTPEAMAEDAEGIAKEAAG